MTQEQFREYLAGFFKWSAGRERPLKSWLADLTEWAATNYNKESNAPSQISSTTTQVNGQLGND